MSKKICKKCKIFIEDSSVCPICGGNDFTETCKGKLVVFKPEESEIARNLKLKKEGTYAIKIK